jgi:AAA15 family ATPase/GTPase
MENQHLTYFKVENFKKFDSLEVKDIGQFNLIVGDNNVGKTCLLEALLFDKNPDRCIENIHHSLCRRLIHIHPNNVNSKNPSLPVENYFTYLKNNLSKDKISFSWNNQQLEFEDVEITKLKESDFQKQKTHNYEIGRPNYWIKIFINNKFEELQFMYLDDFKTKYDHGYLPIINRNSGYDRDLVQFFKEIKFEDLEFLKNSLKNLFFEDFQEILPKYYFGRELLSIKLKRNPDFVPITYYGDGFVDFIRYILEISKNSNGRLMIDEVANGIHYLKLQRFWYNTINLCKKMNIQLFATTHSEECIKAFYEASKELNLKEKIRLISLEEGKNEKIYATTYNFENIEAGLYSNIEFRA